MAKHLANSTGQFRFELKCVPQPARLDTWSTHAWRDGLQVDGLRDLDGLRVRTVNTLYSITIISAHTGEALVQGGAFFPQPGRAVILGSSLGGAFLKVRGIYCGYSLELYATGTRIVTSAVQSVDLATDIVAGRVQ